MWNSSCLSSNLNNWWHFSFPAQCFHLIRLLIALFTFPGLSEMDQGRTAGPSRQSGSPWTGKATSETACGYLSCTSNLSKDKQSTRGPQLKNKTKHHRLHRNSFVPLSFPLPRVSLSRAFELASHLLHTRLLSSSSCHARSRRQFDRKTSRSGEKNWWLSNSATIRARCSIQRR